MNPADQLGWRGCERIGGLGYKILVEDRGPEAEANTGQRVSVGTKILDNMFVIYVTRYDPFRLWIRKTTFRLKERVREKN